VRLISRAVLREIAPPFLLGFAAYTFVLLIRTIVVMTDFFVRRSATFPEVLRLVALSIPWIVVLTLPMAFLLGVLIGIGRLSADSELTALRACGVGPASIYRPTLAAAAVLSSLVFLLYNTVLPWANEELTRSLARAAATSAINLVQPRTFREPRAGETLFFDRIGADGRSFEGVFLRIGDGEQEDRLILARRGALNLERDELWLDLFDSTVHEYDPADPSRYRTYANERQRILFAGDIWNEPRSRITYEKALRAQSLGELLATARRVEGRSPERYRLAWVEIYKKFSIPLACFAFAFIGIPLAETSRRAGRGGGFALSLAILVVYYVLLSNGETWAQEGKLPPAVAMWLPNVLLLVLGFLAMRRTGVERARWGLPSFLRRRSERAPRERRSLFGELLTFPATLDRYVLRKFFSALVLVLLSIVLLSLVVDYSEKVDEIIRNKPPAEVVAGYYRYFVLSVTMDVAPFAVLLATLVALGVLSKNNEDTAFRASGVSLYRLGAPILVTTALAAVLVFTLGEYVLPFAKQREERYKHRIFGRPADYGLRTLSERNWYYGRDGRIWHREATDSDRGILVSPSVFEFDRDFQLVRRIVAREAVWQEDAWLLRQGWERGFDGPRETGYRNFLELRVAGDPPAAFARERRTPAEMRFRELQRHARRLKRTGYPTANLETALHAKVARPLLLPIMALLALPFAFRIGKRGALAGIGIGLALGITLLIGTTLFTKLGDVGALPPFLAAWTPSILFATAAAYLLLKVRT
jgi:LPS export ABC transporter permease LptF/LPS export ABC transporter permease LptG